jgi:hypothetical protein
MEGRKKGEMKMDKNVSGKVRKPDGTIRYISGSLDKEDYISLKTVLLQTGETLEDAIRRMVKNFIKKGGNLDG